MIYILERKVYGADGWEYWKPYNIFCPDSSENPRLEALAEFEKKESSIGEMWRVTSNGKLIIEQRG